MDRCVNCTIATGRSNTIGKRILDDDAILSVIRQWRASQPVTNENYVCQACWKLAQDVVLGNRSIEAPSRVGHSSVCVRCGRSLLARRHSHLLRNDSPRESAICNVIRQRILPQTIGEADRICHSCWLSADRAAVRMRTGSSTTSQSNPLPAQSSVGVSGQFNENHDNLHEQNQATPIVEPGTKHTEPTIVLPEYMRSVESERRCFIEGCKRSERNRVPLATRKMLINKHKYYVPQNNRLCDRHLAIETWDFLDSLRSNCLQTFTARHIQDMMTLKDSHQENSLNFSNIDDMEDNMLYTWTGFTKAEFHLILEEVPQLSEIRNSSSVLAVFLMKLRTGDSNERLATLFKKSKTTISQWVIQARDMLTEHFVQRNLDKQHITKELIQEKILSHT